MKILVLLLLVSARSYQCAEIEPYSVIREIINQFIDSLRDVLPEELPLRDREISGPGNDYISSNASTYNGAIGGLQYFNVDIEYAGILVPVPSRATIVYDRLSIRSEYITRLGINALPLATYDNSGNIQSEVTNTVLRGNVEFSLTPLRLQLRGLALQVGDTGVSLQGLLGSRLLSRWTSALLTRYGAQIINDSADILAPRIEDIINGFLTINFPRVLTTENSENVDYSTYTREELDEKANMLKISLDNIIRELKALSKHN